MITGHTLFRAHQAAHHTPVCREGRVASGCTARTGVPSGSTHCLRCFPPPPPPPPPPSYNTTPHSARNGGQNTRHTGFRSFVSGAFTSAVFSSALTSAAFSGALTSAVFSGTLTGCFSCSERTSGLCRCGLSLHCCCVIGTASIQISLSYVYKWSYLYGGHFLVLLLRCHRLGQSLLDSLALQVVLTPDGLQFRHILLHREREGGREG